MSVDMTGVSASVSSNLKALCIFVIIIIVIIALVCFRITIIDHGWSKCVVSVSSRYVVGCQCSTFSSQPHVRPSTLSADQVSSPLDQLSVMIHSTTADLTHLKQTQNTQRVFL